MNKSSIVVVVFSMVFCSSLWAGDNKSLVSRAVGVQDSASVNLCEGLKTHKKEVSVVRMSKPPYLKAFRDPAFGTKTIRISNAEEGEVVKPMYSTIQSWNADESRLLLYHTQAGSSEAGHHLYDGMSYQHLGKLDILATDVEQVFWHHKDPDVLFYVSAYFKFYGQFIKYNIKTNEKQVIASFDAICGKDVQPTSGNGVMMQPLNDDLFGFRCNVDGVSKGFSYRVSNGKVNTLELGGVSGYDQWTAPMPSTSGKYYFVTDKILEQDLSTVRFSMDLIEFHSHSSLGQLANGNDALFTTAFDVSPQGCDGGLDKGVGSLVVHDFERKTCEVIVGEFNGYGYPGSGTHVSAVAHNNPGWALMSTIGYGQFEYHANDEPAPILFSEVYLVNTDPADREVCRIAHHRSEGKAASNTRYHAYFGEPHATLSPSGTRVIYGSDWYGSGSVDAYIVELPAFRK